MIKSKFKIQSVFFYVFIFISFSCSKENVDLNENSEYIYEIERFMYDGELLELTYFMEENGEISYYRSEENDFIINLLGQENTCVYEIIGEDVIYLFNNQKEVEEFNQQRINKLPHVKTSSSNQALPCYAYVYEHTNYWGGKIDILNGLTPDWSRGDVKGRKSLSDVGWNDKISSFQLGTRDDLYLFISFSEHRNFKGKSWNIEMNNQNKSYHEGDLHNNKMKFRKYWGDNISSIKWRHIDGF